MLIDKNGTITIITQEKASCVELHTRMQNAYESMENDNIIVVLNDLSPVKAEEVAEFLSLSNTHRNAKHSFVIVSHSVNIDEASEELIIVPTLQEAYDLIEMEEMERDLGF